jgi:hypothetical protein
MAELRELHTLQAFRMYPPALLAAFGGNFTSLQESFSSLTSLELTNEYITDELLTLLASFLRVQRLILRSEWDLQNMGLPVPSTEGVKALMSPASLCYSTLQYLEVDRIESNKLPMDAILQFANNMPALITLIIDMISYAIL